MPASMIWSCGMDRITLADALRSGDLEPFIRQAEADGVAGNKAGFERIVKALPPEDRTSRSRGGGSSTGK
jgi:hypothetical protein